MQAPQTSVTIPPASGENITKALKKLFDDNHPKFGRKHALASPTAVWMNPCLELKVRDEWDALGLPVSSSVAQAVKESLGDTLDLRTGLDIDATCVRFANPEWDRAVNKTARSMFASLALSGSDSSTMTLSFKGLRMLTSGSRMEYAGVNNANQLATLIFVLPTAHEGGAVSARLGEKVTTMSTSSGSAYTTSILCWCSDALVDQEPITSGVQVHLRYDLFHAGQSPVPVVFDSQPVARAIAQAFDTWIKKRDEKYCPKGLHYVVTDDDTYGETHIQHTSFQDLQDPDFGFINLVREQAQKVGISATLGQLKQVQYGTPYSPCKVRQDHYGSDEEDDVATYEETAELRAEDIDDVMWYFTPFLPEGKRGEEEEILASGLDLMFNDYYLKNTVPEDIEWDGWQGEGNTHMQNLSFRLGLRLELPNPLKRKELDSSDEEAKIVELERKMRAFDEAAAGGSLL